MVLSRKTRTSLFRKRVEKEWSEYYWEFVLKYSDKPWDWSGISCNPNITMGVIEKYPDKPWNWGDISYNPNITMDIIEKYPNKPWSWNGISCNPNITMEFINKNLDKPWFWYWISCNPNISMEFIEKYPDKPWDWIGISLNLFNYEKELFIEKRMRKYLSAYRIQQYYLTALCDPYCRIGITRIRRNYNECFNEDGSMKKLPDDFKLI